MNFQISGLIFFYLISCVMGMMVAVILWRYPRENNHHNRLLSASFFFLSLGQTIGVLVQTRLILSVPHLYRFGNLFALLVMPLSWMYMRMLLKNKKFSSKDFVHFLPALIFFIDYS